MLVQPAGHTRATCSIASICTAGCPSRPPARSFPSCFPLWPTCKARCATVAACARTRVVFNRSSHSRIRLFAEALDNASMGLAAGERTDGRTDGTHVQNLAHGDIKDENILVDRNFDVRLIDFGATSFLHQRGTQETFIGTMHYASPEILLGAAPDRCPKHPCIEALFAHRRVFFLCPVFFRFRAHPGGEFDHAAAEVWTLGILLYTMMVGTSPFNSATDAVNGRFRLPRYLSSEAYVVSTLVMPTAPGSHTARRGLGAGWPETVCILDQWVHHPYVPAAQPSGPCLGIVPAQAPLAAAAIIAVRSRPHQLHVDVVLYV